MKIGLSMWSVHPLWYDGAWGVDDFVRFCSELPSLQGVELLDMFWRDRETEIPAVLERVAACGLTVACYSASNNFAVSDAQEWTRQLDEVKDIIVTADRLGTQVVRVFSGNLEEGATFEQARSRIVDGLGAAARHAETYGITLCLENHGLLAGKAKQVKDIIQDVGSKYLMSTFDTGNFLLVGDDPVDACRTLGPWIGHVHLKDFRKIAGPHQGHTYTSLSGDRYIGTVPGVGEIDFASVLTELRRAQYDGWLSIEYEGDGDALDGSRASVHALNAMLSR